MIKFIVRTYFIRRSDEFLAKARLPIETETLDCVAKDWAAASSGNEILRLSIHWLGFYTKQLFAALYPSTSKLHGLDRLSQNGVKLERDIYQSARLKINSYRRGKFIWGIYGEINNTTTGWYTGYHKILKQLRH